MIKQLRSLIHEKFPMELRVEIELLSRRRDIINAEKQEELFRLLRKYDLNDITPLGPGTNRYAFKLNGFVVKVATDHDGKIDNLKEFKMAKRLYPYVTKIYEVSDNGTLLVAEYIQPFSSYGEMLQHADQIREILRKLSSVYLIGDVGVTSKNYANWGTRIGSEEPVCLDFAYVYEVSSELFICRHCKANAMLVPNNDFTELHCPTPGCGHRYTFEDIRSRIGNDIHRHEIGDLTQEGYLLDESNVETTLTEERSNYLVRKKEKEETKQEKEEETVEEDNFIMPYSLNSDSVNYMKSNDLEGGIDMSNMDVIRAVSADIASRSTLPIRATAVVRRPDADATPKAKQRVVAQAKIHQEPVAEEPVQTAQIATEQNVGSQAGVAFSMKMKAPETPQTVETEPAVQEEDPIPVIPKEEVPQVPVQETPNPAVAKVKAVAKVVAPKVEETVKAEPAPAEVKQTPVVEKKGYQFSDSFRNNTHKAFSKISNMVGSDLHIRIVFDDVKTSIRDKKMYPETFYNTVQNAVFRSLVAFCNFKEENIKTSNNKGFRKTFTPPEVYDEKFERTMVFISRIWDNRDLNQIDNPAEMMEVYRQRYNDCDGFQVEWVDFLRTRLKEKMQIDNSGLDRLVKAICAVWLETVTEPEEEVTPDPDPVAPSTGAAVEVPNNDQKEAEMVAAMQQAYEEAEANPDDQNEELNQQLQEAIAANPVENPTDDIVRKILAGTATAEEDPAEIPNFSGSYSMATAEPTEPTEGENYDVEEEIGNEEESACRLAVEIFPEDDIDVIKVRSEDAFGPIGLTFYTNLDNTTLDNAQPSIVDDRNGIWDWLIHMVPDMMFRTKDPDKWINEINNSEPEEDLIIRVAILDFDPKAKEYTMGVFYLLGVFFVDEENEYHITFDEEVLAKINRIIKEDVGYGRMSHLKRSLSMTQLIYSEDAWEAMTSAPAENQDEDQQVTEPEDGYVDDAEEAAIKAMLSGEVVPEDAEPLTTETAEMNVHTEYNIDPNADPDPVVVSESYAQQITEPEEEFVEAPKAETKPVQQAPQKTFQPIHRKKNASNNVAAPQQPVYRNGAR